MKDFANRTSSNKRNNKTKRSVFRSKKKSIQVVSSNTILGLLIFSILLACISFFYFKTDIIGIEPRVNKNNVTIDFPTSLIENSILIEADNENNFLSCEYFVQIGAYGNKKYAYEATNILSETKLLSINEIYSSSDPGKLLHSVLSGPYENRSAANNAKEKITKKGFDPRLRTLCKKK